MPRGPRSRGWRWDEDNDRLHVNIAGTDEAYFNADGLTVAGALTVDTTVAVTTNATVSGTLNAANISTAAETGAGATIATGVLTVTDTVVIPLPESGTTDTVDTITKAGVVAGDLLLLHVPATNTITVDDANINLAAATRAIAPGGSLLLVYDGTEWSEVAFTAATDNV